jgi:hypothetical protein
LTAMSASFFAPLWCDMFVLLSSLAALVLMEICFRSGFPPAARAARSTSRSQMLVTGSAGSKRQIQALRTLMRSLDLAEFPE